MKDVVFIIVDSLCEQYLGKRFSSLSSTPFLDEFKKDCIYASNLYSQGPYTEAGTKALLCGVDALDDKGYMFRFDKSKYFITDVFKENNFETHALMYPTCVLSKRTLNNIDHMKYTSGFLFDVLWTQKLLYYVDLFQKHLLTDAEYIDVRDLLKLIFEAWIDFMDVDAKPKEYVLISELINAYDYNKYLNILKDEERKLDLDYKSYIDDLFTKKEKHVLNTIPSTDYGKIIKNKNICDAFSEHPAFIKKLKAVQKGCNKKNNKVPKGTLLKCFSRLKKSKLSKYTFGEYLYRIQLLNRWKDVETIKNGHNYKTLVSAHTQIDGIINALKEKTEKPKFIISHIEEPHYFTTYLSFDSFDTKLISKEIQYAESYLDSLTNDYRGLASYQLSLRYIDKEICRLYETLKASGDLNNTMICIVADHGSSYNCCPLRSRMVNNFHSENYHIPLYIYDGIHRCNIDTFCTSKDVVPTILDCLGIKENVFLTGKSILSSKSKYANIEYMGPGCPDMRRRPVWMAVRDKDYLVCYRGKLIDGFNEKSIVEIFDLNNDKEELNNLIGIRNKHIEELIAFLKHRFENMYENNKEWINKQ